MKNTFYKFVIVSIASTALATLGMAQPANNPGTSSGSSGVGSSDNQPHQSGAASSDDNKNWNNQQLSATSRGQMVRGSKLMGAEVKDSSGSQIGRITDVIVNPNSGKIDFAIISRNGGSSNVGSSTGTTTTQNDSNIASTQGNPTPAGREGGHTQNTGSGLGSLSSQSATESASDSSSGSHMAGMNGNMIAVPWSLLRSGSSSGSAVSSSSSGQMQEFTLNVDKSKLERAPTFNSSSWSEISRPGWSQRVNSYYGAPGSMDGAASPAGSSSGSDRLNR